jgi:hypothetical protein
MNKEHRKSIIQGVVLINLSIFMRQTTKWTIFLAGYPQEKVGLLACSFFFAQACALWGYLGFV